MSDYNQCMSSADALLMELAIAYHHRSEAYDRTVCTGKLTSLGRLPATSKQKRLSMGNAWMLHDIMVKDAERLGFSREEWNQAIKMAARDIDWRTTEPDPSKFSWLRREIESHSHI